jgi:hypothetical protein
MMIAIAFSTAAVGQMKADKAVSDAVIAMEKKGWETWKMQDKTFLQGELSSDAVIVGDQGVADKTQYFKDSFTDCKVKSYSLSDWNVTMFDKDTAMVTYKSMSDAMCGGKQAPANQWNSSLYMKRGSKWMNVFYQTSNIMP